MSPPELKTLLQGFVSYVTEPGEKSDETLLEICDRILAAYHDTRAVFDPRKYPEPPEELEERRPRIGALFANYGFYCLTSSKIDAFEAGATVGDAIDDLADLSREFEATIWRFDHTSADDALWHFRTGYEQHWGQHMRDFQAYLSRRITSA